MTDRNDIIRAFERELNKKEEAFCSNEEKLLQSIAKGTCSQQYSGKNDSVSEKDEGRKRGYILKDELCGGSFEIYSG